MWQYIYIAHTCTAIQVCCSWGYDGLNWHSRHRTVLKCNTKIVKKKIMIFWFLPKTSSQLWSFNVSKCSRWSMLKTHFVSHSLSIDCIHKSKLLQKINWSDRNWQWCVHVFYMFYTSCTCMYRPVSSFVWGFNDQMWSCLLNFERFSWPYSI